MPVEPIPCDDGGTGTPGACACAPSIATSPLCRADGTPILVVLRSPCGTCGTPAPDPAVVGWVDPLTGAFTPGAVPAGAGPCTGTTPDACSCAPSITSMPLCRPDGSTIALIIRSACTDCGATAPDPGIVGWLDPVTGVFTPGPAPADAAPCQLPGCIETLCRQRCDDTTGDGTADTTYSELWCIRADGSAELVLTYQDDPSAPYTPVAPVACTYGCPDDETVLLCDDSGPFLRRYTFLNGAGSYEDVALDGMTPHVVTGTVGACAGSSTGGDPPCEAQTTPAATVGLCLADGTPIAVVITRDCATSTVTQDGWLNLSTGAYSAGAPPAGAQPCGDSRAFELGGLLCDVLADGTVAAVVLVEYEYNPDGSLAAVRLVNPADGTTYTLQGELTVCPAGSGGGPVTDPDLTVLCDVQTDGTAVPFLRDYRRDPVSGLITGHTDYALDGTPYAPTGTVGVCPAEDPTPCVRYGTLTLCDTAPDGTVTPFLRHLAYDCNSGVTSSADTLLDGTTAYTAAGTVGVCAPDPDCPAQQIIEQCRCDDTTGDGLPDVAYVELLAVDCEGTLTSLGTYTDGYTAPYTPVAPVDCDAIDPAEGAPPAFGVQARRIELAAGESWDAADWPVLQSVTAVAHGGTGTITTADGPSTLHTGESASWSVARDTDALLTGPLVITADTGTVTLNITTGVTL